MSANNDIAVRVGADVTSLKQGMREGSKSVGLFSQNTSRDLKKVASNIAKVGAAAAAAGAVGLVAMTKQATVTGRQLQNLSRLANASNTEFQRMSFGAGALGIENEKLSDILKDVTDRVGDFVQTGGGPMADFFENIAPKVGVTAEQFRKLSGPQALQLFYTSLERANLSQSDMTFYLEAMASDLTALEPLLRNNGKLLQEQGDRAERLGIVLSDIELQQLDQGAQSFLEMSETIKMASTLIGANMIPYMDELLLRFGDVAEEAGGVRGMVESMVATSLTGFGKMADGLHYVHVGFKTLVLAGHTFNAAMVTVTEGVLEAFTFLRDGAATIVNQIIESVNQLPGVDIATVDPFTDSAFMQGIRQMGADSRQMVVDLYNDLGELATRELPSAKVEAFLAAVAQRSEEAAAAVVEARRQMMGGGDDDEGGGMNATDAAAMDTKLEALRDRLLQEHELMQKKYEQDMTLLNEALEAQRLTESEHQALAQSLLLTHQQKMTEIERTASQERADIAKAEADAKRQIIGDALSDLTTLMNTGSRKLFEIGKAAAIGNAIINTHEGITAALKLPFPYNLAAAAATAAKGFASVSAIRAQSFGGGGAGARATGSNTAAVNAATTPVGGNNSSSGPQQNTVINLSGDFFGETQIRSLLERINETTRNGGRIIIG